MVEDTGELKKIMVRLSPGDYADIEKMAEMRGTALATYVREIIQAHLMSDNMEVKVKETVREFLLSESFNDILIEKMSQFFNTLIKK